jgi:hypothetical protein
MFYKISQIIAFLVILLIPISIAAVSHPASQVIIQPSGQTLQQAINSGTFGSQWQNGTGGVVYYNGGNVGIGTGTPDSRLHAQSDNSIEIAKFQGYISNLNADVFTSVVRLAHDNNDNYGGFIKLFRQAQGQSHDMRIGTSIAGTDSDFITLRQGGNVGIGTTTPTKKLEVAGDVMANVYYDKDSPNEYYVDPSSTSVLNGIITTSILNYGDWTYYLNLDETSTLNTIHASILKDKEDTNYYVNPAGTSKLSTLNVTGSLNALSTLKVTGLSTLSTLNVSGSVNMLSTLNVAGNVNINGDLNVPTPIIRKTFAINGEHICNNGNCYHNDVTAGKVCQNFGYTYADTYNTQGGGSGTYNWDGAFGWIENGGSRIYSITCVTYGKVIATGTFNINGEHICNNGNCYHNDVTAGKVCQNFGYTYAETYDTQGGGSGTYNWDGAFGWIENGGSRIYSITCKLIH